MGGAGIVFGLRSRLGDRPVEPNGPGQRVVLKLQVLTETLFRHTSRDMLCQAFGGTLHITRFLDSTTRH